MIGAERLLWPYEPGVACNSVARPFVDRLRRRFEQLPLERLCTAADVGRHLGARVFIAPLRPPRQGWTWYRSTGPVIEVANWLPPDIRDLVTAHEVCHVVLGPLRERHNRLVERVCNWGAGHLVERLMVEST